jgi:hypothetical protein
MEAALFDVVQAYARTGPLCSDYLGIAQKSVGGKDGRQPVHMYNVVYLDAFRHTHTFPSACQQTTMLWMIGFMARTYRKTGKKESRG